MPTDRLNRAAPSVAPRVTRCQLLWALLFLVGVSALGWYVVARLIG